MLVLPLLQGRNYSCRDENQKEKAAREFAGIWRKFLGKQRGSTQDLHCFLSTPGTASSAPAPAPPWSSASAPRGRPPRSDLPRSKDQEADMRRAHAARPSRQALRLRPPGTKKTHGTAALLSGRLLSLPNSFRGVRSWKLGGAPATYRGECNQLRSSAAGRGFDWPGGEAARPCPCARGGDAGKQSSGEA